MRKSLVAIGCLALAVVVFAIGPARASAPLDQLFYERRWAEFDKALSIRPRWTPREACLAANAAWLRQDWVGAVGILTRYRKALPAAVVPYADMLRALGLERTGRAEEAGRLAKTLWNSRLPEELRYYLAYLCERLSLPPEKGVWSRKMLEASGPDSGKKVQALSLLLSSSKGTEKDALELLEIQPLDAKALEFLKRPGARKSIAATEALGVASALSGNPLEAVAFFEAVPPTEDGKPGLSAKGKFWHALSLYRGGRRAESVLIWESLAQEGGSYAVSSVRRIATASSGGLPEARAALERLSRGESAPAEAALLSLASLEGMTPMSEWAGELLRRFPSGGAASRLRWQLGWKEWDAGEPEKAGALWEKALDGVPEGLERARLLYWLARSARKTGNETLARGWEARLAAQEPLSVYAWRVFPQGPPGLAAMKRKNWAVGVEPLESWGFVTYAKLRLEAKGGGQYLARAAWLAAWNGDFAESVRLAARASLRLPKGETLTPEFLSLAYPKAYASEVGEAARRFGLDPLLLWAVMRQESAFDAGAVSSAGAMGLMQLMPATAKGEAEKTGIGGTDFWSPKANILLGAAHLARHLQSFGSVEKALAAYNAGGGSVAKWNGKPENLEEWVEGIPYPETNDYVRKVMGNYAVYKALEGR